MCSKISPFNLLFAFSHSHHSISQGIPETAEVAVPVAHFPANQATSGVSPITEASAAGAAPVSGAPNSSPLNLFPQV